MKRMFNVWSPMMVAILLIFPNLSLSSGITGKGLKLGLNLANLHGEDVEEADLKTKTGFCAGIFFHVQFN